MIIFTRIARTAGSVVLWVLTIIGAASLALWAASAAGLVKPLIVVSGSMAPEINTGDLLLSLPKTATDLEVGDVATIRGGARHELITHRVVEVEADASGSAVVRMQGDANDTVDPHDYVVPAGMSVWTPWMQVPGAGVVIDKLTTPTVAVPLVVGLLALCSLAVFPAQDDRREREASKRSAGTEQTA
ncbi:signal peptidase I [Agromyces protaetiae]|nr:signal peptidase I [Agromyces protaetiae]